MVPRKACRQGPRLRFAITPSGLLPATTAMEARILQVLDTRLADAVAVVEASG